MNKIIIFDYDGVIVDSLNIYEKAVISTFQKNGCTQMNSRESFLKLFDNNFFESAIRVGIPREKIPAILKELEMNLQPLQTKLKLFDGIREVLAQLEKKAKIYIVTSNLTDIVKSHLNSQNITAFEDIIGADREVSKIKKLETIKSKYPNSEYFYVGDTKGDMVEGKLAGVKTIAVTWGWHDKKRLEEGSPDFVVEKPSEILSLTEKI